MAANTEIVHYVPKRISTEEEGKKKEASPEDEDVIKSIASKLSSGVGFTAKDFFPIEFEKDDDTNFHIDFMHSAANIRARNYNITECTQLRTKFIAGKIIPAIATTTAMITGAVCAEIYKFVQGFDNIESYTNAFINLALPLFVMTEPSPTIKVKTVEMDPIMGCKVKAVPEGYITYERIEV